MYGQSMERDKQFVLCRELVLFKNVSYQRFHCRHSIHMYTLIDT